MTHSERNTSKIYSLKWIRFFFIIIVIIFIFCIYILPKALFAYNLLYTAFNTEQIIEYGVLQGTVPVFIQFEPIWNAFIQFQPVLSSTNRVYLIWTVFIQFRMCLDQFFHFEQVLSNLNEFCSFWISYIRFIQFAKVLTGLKRFIQNEPV